MPKARSPRPARPGRRFVVRRIPRLDAAGVHEIARELVTGQGFIALGKPEVEAFRMMLSFTPFGRGAAQQVGALYARYSDGTVPGRAINGYPIFLTMRLIHRDDAAAVLAEWRRLEALLDGGPTSPGSTVVSPAAGPPGGEGPTAPDS